MAGPIREPNPDSPPREEERGSIEQVDEPHDPREPGPEAEDVPDAGDL